MSFVIVENPKVRWPVSFRGYSAEGQPVDNEFEITFVITDEEAHEKWLRRAIELQDRADGTGDAVGGKAIADLFDGVIDDWSGVQKLGAGGEVIDVPYTVENLAMLMRLPNVAKAIGDAHRDCRAGGRAKN